VIIFQTLLKDRVQPSQGALCSHPAALITYCAPFNHAISAMEAPQNLTSECNVRVRLTASALPGRSSADGTLLIESNYSSTNNWNYHSQTQHYPETGLEAKHLPAFVMPNCTLIQQK